MNMVLFLCILNQALINEQIKCLIKKKIYGDSITPREVVTTTFNPHGDNCTSTVSPHYWNLNSSLLWWTQTFSRFHSFFLYIWRGKLIQNIIFLREDTICILPLYLPLHLPIHCWNAMLAIPVHQFLQRWPGGGNVSKQGTFSVELLTFHLKLFHSQRIRYRFSLTCGLNLFCWKCRHWFKSVVARGGRSVLSDAL